MSNKSIYILLSVTKAGIGLQSLRKGGARTGAIYGMYGPDQKNFHLPLYISEIFVYPPFFSRFSLLNVRICAIGFSVDHPDYPLHDETALFTPYWNRAYWPSGASIRVNFHEDSMECVDPEYPVSVTLVFSLSLKKYRYPCQSIVNETPLSDMRDMATFKSPEGTLHPNTLR